MGPPHDRAVTALVGYLLVFAVVLSGAVVVSTLGVSVLLDSDGDAQMALATGNLRTIDGGLDALGSGAPYRETRLDPVDGGLTYGRSVTVRITASGGGVNLTGSNAVTATGQTVRYDLGGGRSLSYVAGLIAYEQDGGSRAVLREPPDFSTSRSRMVFVLPLARQAPGSPTLVAADDAVPVVIDRSSAGTVRRTGTTTDGATTVIEGTITVEGSGVTGAWRAYFADREAFRPTSLDGDAAREYAADTDGDGTADVAGASFSTERLYIRTVTAGVGLSESL